MRKKKASIDYFTNQIDDTETKVDNFTIIKLLQPN